MDRPMMPAPVCDASHSDGTPLGYAAALHRRGFHEDIARTVRAAILATLAAISIASAADNKTVKAPQPDVTTTGAAPRAPYGGLTPKEHDAIPYQPCIDAKGWVNGKLVCDNRN
jgi:hypothetical protein